MPPEYPTETHEKKSKKKLIFTLLLITILIAGATTLGLLYYKTKTDSDKELSNKQNVISSLEKRNANYLKQIDALKKTDESDAAEINSDNTFRQIPELGVQYALNDSSSKLTYAYTGVGMVGFSNVGIVDADKEKVCLGKSPLGGFVKVASNENYSGTTATQAAEKLLANAETKNTVKKVGEFYVFYQSPQAPCAGTNTQLNGLITPTARMVVTEALQSLKSIE